MGDLGIEITEYEKWIKLVLNLGNKNEINQVFNDAFARFLDTYGKNDQIRAVLITARGEYFSNGFDPKALLGAGEETALAIVGGAFRLTQKLYNSNIISICAINGHCMGMGAVLSLFCDFRFIADKKARIGFPEALIGMAVPNAPAILLQDLVGGKMARELAITGRALKPDEAGEIGLIDEIYSAEELVPKAEKFAAKMAKLPAQSIAGNKIALRFRYSQGLMDAAWEQDIQNSRFILNASAQEGLKSIIEGRRPVFND